MYDGAMVTQRSERQRHHRSGLDLVTCLRRFFSASPFCVKGDQVGAIQLRPTLAQPKTLRTRESLRYFSLY
ncbi:hypothetical protein PI125_g2368 [Phytophthora idaei]|nr:hypothetical protein PI125_g2368 [Phytophthora idaei]